MDNSSCTLPDGQNRMKSHKPKVLIVEDDEAVCSQWRWALQDDFEIITACDRAGAVDAFRAECPDLSVLDLGLPPERDTPSEGLALLACMRSVNKHAKVIVVTGLAAEENALLAVGEGACDFLRKPVAIDELRLLLQHCHNMGILERQVHARHWTAEPSGLEILRDQTGQVQEIYTAIRKVARADAPVLILGESGTGKETVARTIHQLSGRAHGPFIVVECAAMPPELLDVELMGMEQGSSSKGVSWRPGRLEAAAGGTLFLNGVTRMPLALQARLLRFVQYRHFERGPGHEICSVDVRVIAADHVDLAAALASQQFRSDLYYLLAVVVIQVPPLRDLRSSLQLLAESLVRRMCDQYCRPHLRLADEACRAIERYSWPGNLRELESCLRRAVILAEHDILTESDLHLPAPRALPGSLDLREARQGAEREVILRALRRHHGRIAPAAAELGISRPTLYALMQRLGIQRPSGDVDDEQDLQGPRSSG